MSKAAQLVSKLMEEGPDELDPKHEMMRTPRQLFSIEPADYENDQDEEYVWRNKLAQQLNRLSELAERLHTEGRKLESYDLDELIKRVSEYEGIHPRDQ
jgi:hypothetical protein